MYEVKIYANFEEALGSVIFTARPVEVIIDYLIPDELPKVKPEGVTRFVVNIQPEGQFNDLIRKYSEHYDYLLTFIPELLILPKARFFIGLTPFCEPDRDIVKRFGVSTVFSGRNCLPGHRLRHELSARQSEITAPKHFYYGLRSGQTGPLQLRPEKRAKKIVMADMFHIAIDSYDYPNSFSEKLIDPLLTLTVPIYWGTRTIDRYFNKDGIIHVDSVDDIIRTCNKLKEQDYWDRIEAMEDNYAKALQFDNYTLQLKRKIDEVLNEDT